MLRILRYFWRLVKFTLLFLTHFQILSEVTAQATNRSMFFDLSYSEQNFLIRWNYNSHKNEKHYWSCCKSRTKNHTNIKCLVIKNFNIPIDVGAFFGLPELKTNRVRKPIPLFSHDQLRELNNWIENMCVKKKVDHYWKTIFISVDFQQKIHKGARVCRLKDFM